MSELSARSAAITISSERPSPDAPVPSVIVASLLPSGERRLTRSILHETFHARALVLCREQAGEVQPLDLQASVEVDVEAAVDGLLGGSQRERRAARVPGDQLDRCLV